MTIHEQVALATDKVAHWNSKRDHALTMLTKWQNRLSALQAKGKPQPTAKKLPGNACARYRKLSGSRGRLARHRGGSWRQSCAHQKQS
jgi:hypothetical protein